MALSTEFLRGFALAGVPLDDASGQARLLSEWIWAVRVLLAHGSGPPYL